VSVVGVIGERRWMEKEAGEEGAEEEEGQGGGSLGGFHYSGGRGGRATNCGA